MDVMEQIEDVETKLLDSVGTTQEKIIELNSQVADRLAEVTPRVAEVTDRVRERTAGFTHRIKDRFGDRLPSTPKVELPRPKALVDNYFGTVSRLTELNHRFADQLLSTWEGVTARSRTAETGTAGSGSAKGRSAKSPAAKSTKTAKSAPKATKTATKAAAKNTDGAETEEA